MIKEIAQYIEDNSSLVIGTDLFAGFAPDTVQDCVILIESGGRPDFYLPDFTEKMVQVLSRASDYFTARSNALAVYDLLHGESAITLPVVLAGEEYLVDTVEAVSAPQSLGQDDKGLFNISTNYLFRIQDK